MMDKCFDIIFIVLYCKARYRSTGFLFYRSGAVNATTSKGIAQPDLWGVQLWRYIPGSRSGPGTTRDARSNLGVPYASQELGPPRDLVLDFFLFMCMAPIHYDLFIVVWWLIRLNQVSQVSTFIDICFILCLGDYGSMSSVVGLLVLYILKDLLSLFIFHGYSQLLFPKE